MRKKKTELISPLVMFSLFFLIYLFAGANTSHAVRFASTNNHTQEAIMTEPLLPTGQPIQGFVPYQNDHFNFSVNVPVGWKLYEHYDKDSVFGYVIRYIFLGPPESSSGVGFTSLEFRFVPKQEFGGTLSNLTDYADTIIIQKNRKTGSVIEQKDTTLIGLPAKEMALQYTIARPENSGPIDPPTLVTTFKKFICFEYDNHFVEVNFHSSANDVKRYISAYETAKATLQF